MKLSQMRYFQAVCLYGSTTRAADSLFVSQPSISMAIKELEEELHVKLFVRQNNRMMLTREGSFFWSASTVCWTRCVRSSRRCSI